MLALGRRILPASALQTHNSPISSFLPAFGLISSNESRMTCICGTWLSRGYGESQSKIFVGIEHEKRGRHFFNILFLSQLVSPYSSPLMMQVNNLIYTNQNLNRPPTKTTHASRPSDPYANALTQKLLSKITAYAPTELFQKTTLTDLLSHRQLQPQLSRILGYMSITILKFRLSLLASLASLT